MVTEVHKLSSDSTEVSQQELLNESYNAVYIRLGYFDPLSVHRRVSYSGHGVEQ